MAYIHVPRGQKNQPESEKPAPADLRVSLAITIAKASPDILAGAKFGTVLGRLVPSVRGGAAKPQGKAKEPSTTEQD